MIYEQKKCMMCGIELLPYIKIIEMNDGSTQRRKLTPKSFCDLLCKNYFEKRLRADESGISLNE